MMKSGLLLAAAAAVCGALAGCSSEETPEQVAIGQFKNACKGGNLSACNGILQHEQLQKESASQAAQSAAASSTGF